MEIEAASVRGGTGEERRVRLSADMKPSRAKRVAEAKAARAARDKEPSHEEEKENDDYAVRGETSPMLAEIVAAWDKRAKEGKTMSPWLAEMMASCDKRVAEEKAALESMPPLLPYEDREDSQLAQEASEFRHTWNSLYSPYYGHFEETTKIPNKRFTHKKPAPSQRAIKRTTLQIFSVKVSRIRGGLQWPLQVFGMVAIRDCVDQKRNVIFNRPRDNCQIITQEVPYLKLIGPKRAVLLLDPATFEVDLKVKGATEAEDDCLSFLAATYINSSQLKSVHFTRTYPCRLSTLEFELGSMFCSLEATIDVRIISGSWPDGFRAQFAASTASIRGAQIMLLDSGDDKVQVAGYGKNITLSRCVVSVEASGQLRISVKALQGERVVVNRNKEFKPRTAGTSDGVLRLGFCTLGFTISWSLVASVA